MPTVKKTTTKTTATKPKVENKKVEEVVENIEEKTEVQNKPIVEETKPTRKRLSKSKKRIDYYDLDLKAEVPVRKIVNGVVGYNCKNVNRYLKWSDNDTEIMMPIGEILNMENESSHYLHDPWLLVDDEEVAKALNLMKLYDFIFEVEDINEFCNLSISMIENKLDSMPKVLREQTITRIVTGIHLGGISPKDFFGLAKMLKRKYEIEFEI